MAGAVISAVPEAIYRVHVNEGSRNKQPPELHGQTYMQIQQEHQMEYMRMFGRT
jgi:hypothetical protein